MLAEKLPHIKESKFPDSNHNGKEFEVDVFDLNHTVTITQLNTLYFSCIVFAVILICFYFLVRVLTCQKIYKGLHFITCVENLYFNSFQFRIFSALLTFGILEAYLMMKVMNKHMLVRIFRKKCENYHFRQTQVK
jgi:hypothetical protein